MNISVVFTSGSSSLSGEYSGGPDATMLQQVRPVRGVCEVLLLAGGVAGQRGNQDARRRVGAAFAQHQMRRQVADGPLAAQCRGVGSDGPHRVHQCGAFTGGCGHSLIQRVS